MAADVSRRAGGGVTGPVAPSPVAPSPVAPSPVAPSPVAKGWTAGRVIALLAGSVLVVACVVLLCGTGMLMWADQQPGGYLAAGAATYSTSGYALASDPARLPGGWGWLGRWAQDVRIRVTATSPGAPVFVAIAPAGDISGYLAGVSYTSVTALGDNDVTRHPGNMAPAPPAAVGWTARVSGTGTATLRWTMRSGDWTVVVMNPGGSPGVMVRAEVSLSTPVLPAFAGGLLAAGLTAGLAGVALIVVPARLAAGGR